MPIVWSSLAILGVLVLFVIAAGIYFVGVLQWSEERTVGLNYYGLPPEGRKAFKRKLAFHARMLRPLLWLSMRKAMDFRKGRVQYKGIAAPVDSCRAEGFAKAEAYAPRKEDVFVVTQMKCGTTWMQHIVFEIVHRGQGKLVENGTAMYAISPWIEGRKSISIEDSKPVGPARPTRIIKTHLPSELCPYSDNAKYVYVVRHPISCFASCIDFVVTNVGAMAPSLAAFEEWYTSPHLMWWGTWTDHVKGWWKRAGEHPDNVLFVYFEDMKKDLPATIRQVAAFLGVPPLDEQELASAAHKCSFAYMQEHQENFEMHPPHLLQTDAEMFVSGSAERHKDVSADARARIARWAAQEMASSDFPMAGRYPDVRP